MFGNKLWKAYAELCKNKQNTGVVNPIDQWRNNIKVALRRMRNLQTRSENMEAYKAIRECIDILEVCTGVKNDA